MALKTYLLAPNFTLEPDGLIRIGNIIADPFIPTKTLSSPQQHPITATHIDSECSYSQDSSKSLHGSIWAEFLQAANANTSGGVSGATLSEYNIARLETVRMKADPSDDEVAERIKEPKVQAAIKAGLFGAAPVYMITGLKIAKGFRLNQSVTSAYETNTAAGLPIAAELSVGAQIGASRAKGVGQSLRSDNDIIFAYQLHVIAQKGWWHKKTEIDVYSPKSAFLNNEEHEVTEEDVTSQLATHLHILEVAEENEYDSVRVLEALDGDEACMCVAFKEPGSGEVE